MFLTEEQARQTWCPHARATKRFTDGAIAINRDEGRPATRCIASICSQWRMALRPVYGDAGEVIGCEATDKGYCGLAGRPEGNP